MLNSFKIFTRQDMSYKNYLDPVSIINEYNTILIPSNIISEYKIGDKITLYNNNKKIYLTSVLASYHISILDISYNFFHIAPSLSRDANYNLKLSINNQQYPLTTFIDNNESCKLINGLLVLNNNYYNHFNNNDMIELLYNQNSIKGKVIYKQNKYNLYKGNTFTTILHILPIEENLDIIYLLNNQKYSSFKFKVRSLDTLKNDRKGSIIISSKTSNKRYLIKCQGINNNYYNECTLNRRIELSDIPKGKYELSFLENNSILDKKIIEIKNFMEPA